MSQTKRTCVFCGGSPVTLEHVFSKAFLAQLTPEAATFVTEYAGQRDADAPIRRGTWERSAGKGGGAEFKTVCGPCNQGWMQELDEKAKPLLTRLCYAENGEIAFPDGNLLLGQWATKIALVLHSIWPDPFIMPAEYAKFRKDQEPLPGSTIWVGAMHRVGDSGGRQMMSTLESSGEVKAYLATFRILHLVFQVLCPLAGARVDRILAFDRFIVQLWPPEAAIHWPPPRDTWLRSEQEFAELDRGFTPDPQ